MWMLADNMYLYVAVRVNDWINSPIHIYKWFFIIQSNTVLDFIDYLCLDSVQYYSYSTATVQIMRMLADNLHILTPLWVYDIIIKQIHINQ